MSKEDIKRMLDNINRAFSEYENTVMKMSDKELWDHCFSDDDIHEDDFCVQELKVRFLYGNFDDAKKANEYLIDKGYTQEEIDEMTKDIHDKVKKVLEEIKGSKD